MYRQRVGCETFLINKMKCWGGASHVGEGQITKNILYLAVNQGIYLGERR